MAGARHGNVSLFTMMLSWKLNRNRLPWDIETLRKGFFAGLGVRLWNLLCFPHLAVAEYPALDLLLTGLHGPGNSLVDIQVNVAAIAEADFMLGRMDVDIHLACGKNNTSRA